MALRRRLFLAALTVFPRLPPRARRFVVRTIAPGYTLGAVVVCTDGDDVLLLRQRHHPGLTLPGGLLRRGELPSDAVCREAGEEVGLDLTVTLPVTTVVEPAVRRVDLIYAARFEGDRSRLRGDGDEVLDICWRPIGALADLSVETAEMLEAWAASGSVGRARPR